MSHHRYLCGLSLPFLALVVLAGCQGGPAASGSFDRDYAVSGPIRLELNNAAGDVDVIGSADGKVHVHAEVRASGFGFGGPQQRLHDTISNPPIEQRGDTIRIGKDLSHLRHLNIAYRIQVPHGTEVSTNVASGAQIVRDVSGPVKAQAASGSIRVEEIDRDAQLNTASGSVAADNVGGDVRVSSASGSVTVSAVKGDVRVNAIAGAIQVTKPGSRVDTDTASGSIDVQGAAHDVRAHAVSGRVSVQGNPGADSYWDLKTVSGGVRLLVPASSNFHLSADAVSGEIRTDVPIMIEEQSKHSLRARIGNGGGRVEVRTVSGEIRLSAAK